MPQDDAGSGDGAFAWLFRREYPAIVRTVALILDDREAAKEVVQEAFVRLLLHWGRVSRYDRPGAWVRRVAIRLAVRSARLRLRRSSAERSAWAPGATAGPADLDLRRAVVGLPRRQRVAVTLFYLEDRPVDEVADLLGCSPSTVRVHLHRARRRLATALRQEDDDDARV
ncbi:MAG TPA: sigma-70 family RNA polymerase sigma factor [Actinomycetes bacterium]|nr:sigma-70 family RNA polymerase sigma factor [Actinomycetes bacterium]